MQDQNIIFSRTCLGGILHEQTIICRQLFACPVVGLGPVKRKEKNASNDSIGCYESGIIPGVTVIKFN